MSEPIVKEVPLEIALEVNDKITEFESPYSDEDFRKRLEAKKHLVIVSYSNESPAGYIVAYDRVSDGSF